MKVFLSNQWIAPWHGCCAFLAMDTLHTPSTASPPPTIGAAPLDIAALLGPIAWRSLSPAIRRRFATGHADATYDGTMRIECSAIGRVFAMLARVAGSPLTGHRQDDVAVSVQVRSDGHGGTVWERDLRLTGTATQRVRSTKKLGPRSGLEEHTAGGLSMALDVAVEDGALVFRSRSYFVQMGAWRMAIPAWLSPGTCRVEHRDEGPGRFRFTLDMVHPLWGRTFHQSGVFHDPKEFQQ